MAKKKRSIFNRLILLVIVFVAGMASGYYVRDRRQDRRVREALERAGDELLDRGRELGESARDSARSALRRLAGDST